MAVVFQTRDDSGTFFVAKSEAKALLLYFILKRLGVSNAFLLTYSI